MMAAIQPTEDGFDKEGGTQQGRPKVDSTPGEKPWFVFPLLATAIVAVSSAAVVFASMAEVPPLSLAAWRLQITSTLLITPGIRSAYSLTPEERQRMLRDGLYTVAAGVLLGAHFGSWVAAIENTSLSHALLAGSTPPIIIAVGMLLTRQPITRGEVIGTGIAAFGAALIARSANSETAVTWYGDLIGVLAAIFFVLYLSIGRTVRSWMPIFAYVLPVNAIAALSLSLGALLVEGAGWNTSPTGLFGYLGSWHYFWRCLYLGAVPGIAGHVSFNALLKWLHPLLIALPGTLEPLIGSLLGLAVGIGTAPGLYTYLGGGILLTSTVVVVFSAYVRELQEGAAKEAAELAMVGQQQAAEAAEQGEAMEGQALLASSRPQA